MNKAYFFLIVLFLSSLSFGGLFGLSYGMQGGVALPLGENRHHLEDGFCLNASVGKPINQYLSLGCQIGYNRWPLILNDWIADLAKGSLSYSQFLLAANLQKKIALQTAIIGKVCTGFYWGNAEIKETDETIQISDYSYGIKVGGGIRYRFLELLAAYDNVFVYGESIHWVSISIGVSY